MRDHMQIPDDEVDESASVTSAAAAAHSAAAGGANGDDGKRAEKERGGAAAAAPAGVTSSSGVATGAAAAEGAGRNGSSSSSGRVHEGDVGTNARTGAGMSGDVERRQTEGEQYRSLAERAGSEGLGSMASGALAELLDMADENLIVAEEEVTGSGPKHRVRVGRGNGRSRGAGEGGVSGSAESASEDDAGELLTGHGNGTEMEGMRGTKGGESKTLKVKAITVEELKKYKAVVGKDVTIAKVFV
jgi:hypothetical protein